MKSYWLRCASSADDDDVAPVGKHRMAVALVLGEEFLDRAEDHTAGSNLQLFAQVGAISRLRRRLAQQLPAAGEGAEELVVEVVAIG